MKIPVFVVAIRHWKTPSLKFLLDPSKLSVKFFLFAFKVLLKQNCLHLVCYAAVSLL